MARAFEGSDPHQKREHHVNLTFLFHHMKIKINCSWRGCSPMCFYIHVSVRFCRESFMGHTVYKLLQRRYVDCRRRRFTVLITLQNLISHFVLPHFCCFPIVILLVVAIWNPQKQCNLHVNRGRYSKWKFRSGAFCTSHFSACYYSSVPSYCSLWSVFFFSWLLIVNFRNR